MNQLTTYSTKDSTFSLSGAGFAILAAGIMELGFNEIQVRMSVDQTVIKNMADGASVVSAIPGDNGEVELQISQVSTLQANLLDWYNALRVARDTGDVSIWASSTIMIRNIVDGSYHQCIGVAPTKVPDKSYQTEAQMVNWIFRCATIIHG